MVPANSPFPCRWWGTSLQGVGLDDQRPDVGTYGRYDFARLPPLPFPLSGEFAWLTAAPAHRQSIRTQYAAQIPGALRFLRESASRMGVKLPDTFTKFMDSASLQDRVRSATDCSIDLCSEPVRSPIGGGWLVHFLADSQGCRFWYLYLTADGSDHAVVSSPDLYSTDLEPSEDDEEQWEQEEPDPAAIAFCAESFESFLGRYWLENEIFFAHFRQTPMPDAARQYIEDYRKR
jgi:hypothetical protein